MAPHHPKHGAFDGPPAEGASMMPTKPSSALLVAIWLLAGIATVAVCARLYTRYWRFTRHYWDDFFVILGWIFSIPLAVQTSIAYNTDLRDGGGNFFLSRPVTELLFYTSLWAVKVSFLIFFKRIGICALDKVRKYWLSVFALTILVYLVLWTLNPYSCWAVKGIAKCEREPSVGMRTSIAFILAATFDVSTDCLIVAIPFAVLYNMRLSLRQKLVLYSLFSLEILTIITAIVRVVITLRGMTGDRNLDLSVVLFLTQVEANTAIVVACTSSLRCLFTQDDRATSPTLDASWKQLPFTDGPERPRRTDTMFTSDLPYFSHKLLKESTFPEANNTRDPSKTHSNAEPLDVGNLLKG